MTIQPALQQILTGWGPDSAIAVRSVQQEYQIVDAMDARSLGQSLRFVAGKPYDVLMVTNRFGTPGAPRPMWFDISSFFQLGRRGFGADVGTVYAEACPGGDYMLVAAASAACGTDEAGHPLCTLYDEAGAEITSADFLCASDCPLGYKRVIRYSGAYVDGQVRACLREPVIAEIERSQPGSIKRLGPSAMQIASWGLIAAGAMVGVSLLSKIGG